MEMVREMEVGEVEEVEEVKEQMREEESNAIENGIRFAVNQHICED